MKVSEIMTEDVITAKKETSIKEAAGLLAKFRIHGVPVVDDDNKVIGIITESDFFTKDESNIFLPTFLEFINNKTAKDIESISKNINSNSKTEDIMTRECFTIHPETSVEELIQHFKEKRFNSFPITNNQGVLVGIVTIMDVIKLL
jgi:CBS domain-containing protein